MSAPLTVRVHGRVASQGSKNKGRGRRFYDASRFLKPWRSDVVDAARAALAETPEFDRGLQAVEVLVEFYIERPKRHHVACDRARPLREHAPAFCSTTPDIDKASRAVLDALTQAGAILDDRYVVVLRASKLYATHEEPPGARIRVGPVWWAT